MIEKETFSISHINQIKENKKNRYNFIGKKRICVWIA